MLLCHGKDRISFLLDYDWPRLLSSSNYLKVKGVPLFIWNGVNLHAVQKEKGKMHSMMILFCRPW
jgi:hypothetical protein